MALLVALCHSWQPWTLLIQQKCHSNELCRLASWLAHTQPVNREQFSILFIERSLNITFPFYVGDSNPTRIKLSGKRMIWSRKCYISTTSFIHFQISYKLEGNIFPRLPFDQEMSGIYLCQQVTEYKSRLWKLKLIYRLLSYIISFGKKYWRPYPVWLL